MPGKHPRPLSVRVSERAHGNCSEGYLWLRVRYARLKARMAVRYPPYDEVAAEMAAEGISGGRGRPLTGKAVRRMWARVVRDIQVDAARRAPRQPQRPPGWRPPAVTPRRPAPAAPAPRPPGGAAPRDHSPQAQLARLQRVVDERSGRPKKPPPPASPAAPPTDDVDARIARLQHEVNQRSGR